ncbi:MAG: hypothetical protein WCY27_03765 [archaeon]|jgi:transcription initiation factor TFIIE subunit alpha|nr:hypothetical protein [archaeon]MDD2477775.1 hypothetical protein [Candidatus ainarchaeum sp.]MDD3084853.1 hypothetical protein [Candidatus ainarchaeum sp.]MDD4221187.1 hypothetical protein [Candidatus ainarchaeum sp.]MDD4662861.1 hypothetical protein [Candidatus ainarchaeum sp.]
MNKLKKELLFDQNAITFLEQIAGPIATDVVKLFKNGSELSPEIISSKLNEKITTVRSTLNSLHYRGIACYKKKRNEKNMYVFLWEIKHKKIVEILMIQEIKKYKKIEMEISDKKIHDFFVCPKNCIEVPFEVAAAYDFKCTNCNSNLKIVNSTAKITKLNKDLKKIELNIKKLENLLEKIKDNTKGYICE